MRFRLQLITVGEDGSERTHSVAEVERDSTLRLETTGLTLAEGKQIESVKKSGVTPPGLRLQRQVCAPECP